MTTTIKTCFKCSVSQPLDSFYKHSEMADGHLNKCIECTKKDSSRNRGKRLEHCRAYDRLRGNRQPKDYLSGYRRKLPNKYKAHTLVGNHVRDGKLVKQPCEICGASRGVAHHDDYDKPLDVRWLCQAHHKQWHSLHGEAKNGANIYGTVQTNG